MIYPAHIRCTKESCQIQSVQQHCKNTALLATEFLKALSLDKADKTQYNRITNRKESHPIRVRGL